MRNYIDEVKVRADSNKLAYFMKQKKVTVLELAEAIDVSPTVISKYKSGKCTPHLYNAIDIADYLQVSVKDIWCA